MEHDDKMLCGRNQSGVGFEKNETLGLASALGTTAGRGHLWEDF